MVQRYDYGTKIVDGWEENHDIFENDDGGYVKHEDYLALAAQVEVLQYQLREKDSMLVEASDRIDANINEKYAAFEKLNASVVHNQELAAQLAELSKLHSDLTNADMVFDDDVHSGYLITTEQIDEMEHLLATPAACLAQVRAEAVIKAANECNKYSGDFCAHPDLVSHAERIRQAVRNDN
jgi:hypothetical protein